MPTSAVIHIQNTAPGPPSAMAVATPAMLPTPMVAARQVISAENGLTSPGRLGSTSRPRQTMRSPLPMRRIGMPNSLTCRYSPVPRISTSMAGPHTKPFSVFIQSWKLCMAASGNQLSR